MNRELDDVDRPFVAQLRALGWTQVEGNLDHPALTGRGVSTDVIQESTLRERLRALNPGADGPPWLDDARLSETVAAITRLRTHRGTSRSRPTRRPPTCWTRAHHGGLPSPTRRPGRPEARCSNT